MREYVRRRALGGAALVALAVGFVSSAQAAGTITAPAFMRFRVFNGSSQSKVTGVTLSLVNTSGASVPPPTVPLPGGVLLADGDAATPAGSLPNIATVGISLWINGTGPSNTAAQIPTPVGLNDTIGSVLAIVADDPLNPGTVTAEVQFSCLHGGIWSWKKNAAVGVGGFGGCPLPITPVARSFQGAFLYNGTTNANSANTPIAAGTYVLRFHDPVSGFAESQLSAQLDSTMRWQDPLVGHPHAIASMLSGTQDKAIVADVDRQAYLAYFVWDGTGTESHGVLHRNDGPPYWVFR